VKVVAIVLTHQAVTFDRLTMLSDTVQSLREADEVLIVDNGSTDGSAVRVEDLGGFAYRPADGVSTCGRGMNVCITAAAKRGDVVVFSNDDIVWRAGWRAQLEAFWVGAPEDVKIVSGLLEIDYPWNKPRGTCSTLVVCVGWFVRRCLVVRGRSGRLIGLWLGLCQRNGDGMMCQPAIVLTLRGGAVWR
jgi:glycosyltransferase involved in cell wall biosynthesis